jgi:large subunit ribosomal protein L6
MKPVPIPGGVSVEVQGRTIRTSGPRGALSWDVPEPIQAVVEDGSVVVRRPNDLSRSKALHGLSRALIANMIHGVHQGYEIRMEVYGTGYGCKVQGNQLHLNAGHMGRGVGRPAQFIVAIPEGLKVTAEVETARGDNEPARFTVNGPDKQQVGQFCAEVRKIHKPQPYQGKGVRYAGEQVRRKAGKVFAGGG